MRHLTLCMLGLGLLAFPLARPAAAEPTHPTWKLCVLHYGPHGGFHDKECHRYTLAKETRRPIGHTWHQRRISASVVYRITWPTFFRPTPPPVRPAGGYQSVWEVTYYVDDAQPMANGQMPYWGAAACGYDVALGARVIVPGVGLLTCADREGQRGNPNHHVDVWGYRPGLGNDYRTVTVYP